MSNKIPLFWMFLAFFAGGLLVFVALQSSKSPISPLKPSKDDIHIIESIEKDLKAGETSQLSIEKIQSLNTAFDSLLEKMSPLAQEELLPRLTVIQWSLRSLPLLTQSGDTKEMLEVLTNALNAEPPDAFPWLAKSVNQKIEDLTIVYKAELLNTADSQIRDKISPNELSATISEIDGLNMSDVELEIAKVKLIAASLNLQLEQIKGIEDRDLRQASVGKIYELSLTLRIGYIGKDSNIESALKEVTSSSEDIIKIIADETQEEEMAKLRNYQKWALEQIQQMNNFSFDNALKIAKSDLRKMKDTDGKFKWGLLSDFPDLLSDFPDLYSLTLIGEIVPLAVSAQQLIYQKLEANKLAYAITSKAMIKYLLPIQEQFLEPPVRQLYSDSFNNAWAALSGQDEQLEVAKKTVDVKKMMPNDLPVNTAKKD